ncbi:MAG TPA: DUF4163 domain-containing protein [Chitinophagales bacterium]|nr:DUF4163 domain-containing protein [Chitinophagales bacterium]
MKGFLLFVLICQLYLVNAQEVTGVYKRFEGTIDNKLGITVDLYITDTAVTGHYYYNTIGKELFLKGSLKNQQLRLKEFVDSTTTGNFSGKMSTDFSTIEGTWSDAARSKKLVFALRSFLPEGSAEVRSLEKSFKYEWRKNAKGEPLGCSAAYTYCYVLNMKDALVEKKINEALLNTDAMGNETAAQLKALTIESMEDEFDTYTDSYQETFTDSVAEEDEEIMDESPSAYNWDYQEAYTVIYNEHNILTVEEFDYSYSGGAHGNYGFSYQVYNLQTGDVLQLNDLFYPNKNKELTAIAEQQLRKDRGISANTSLSESGLLIDRLELKEDFFIDHGGIGFTYNPYEIASYADGPITIYLKWEQVKALIKPVGPIAWVLIR